MGVSTGPRRSLQTGLPFWRAVSCGRAVAVHHDGLKAQDHREKGMQPQVHDAEGHHSREIRPLLVGRPTCGT
eukprot:616023-Pyramimonas_sp.AAC.1